MCRIKEHIKEQASLHPTLICERSIYSGYYCFAKNGYQSGFLSEHEWHIYNTWFSFLGSCCQAPRGFIYLRTDPQLAHARIKKRSRKTEGGVSLEYVEQIHDCYEQFLIHKKDVLPQLKETPVLVLDANQEFEEDSQILSDYIGQVTQFINQSIILNHNNTR
jgi:deoxyadenosine/deoxycytidine kinase